MASHPTYSADYLIAGGLVVTMNEKRELIENGAVAIKGRKIVWVGSAEQAKVRVRAGTTIDATGQAVIPGLVNAHSHLAMTLFRGLADDRPLEAWLARIWPLEAKYATAENIRIGTQLALVEMIRGGITCSADMYWHFAENIRAAREAEFRMVNGPAMIEIVGHGEAMFGREAWFRMVNGPAMIEILGPDGAMSGDLEKKARDFIEQYLDDPLIHLCVQLHSMYTTTEKMLAITAQLSEEYNLLFITHASESKTEVETVKERFGKTPIEYLHAKGLLGPRTLLAHCVHLRDDEIALLRETQTSVAHCPESNLKVGNGVARIPAMLKAGVNVGLGTDGAASNNDLDMFGEMRTAALIHKGVNLDPTVVTAKETFAMATINGARAFNLSGSIGSLEPGKLADMTLVELEAPNVTPMYNIYSHLVYAVDKNDVRTVFINGQLVMQDRKLLTLDEESIKARARSIARDMSAEVEQ